MSRINFEYFAASRPDLSEVWRALGDWLSDHKTVRAVSLARLVRANPQLGTGKLVKALEVLIDAGELVEKYQARHPDGTYLEEVYDSPEGVPESVPDRTHEHYFRRDELDIEPVYELRHGR